MGVAPTVAMSPHGNKTENAPRHSNSSSSVHVVTPPVSTTSTSSRQRVIKRCTVSGCGKIARSRGCCKSHGGGKRCNEPGCALSDQGGGFCIRHGGGKRCEVPGCLKSAQARRVCKAHGGGVRCRVDGCTKTSQGGGCCRTHGGGPRASKKSNSAGDSSGIIAAAAPGALKTELTNASIASSATRMSCDVKVEPPRALLSALDTMAPLRSLALSIPASPVSTASRSTTSSSSMRRSSSNSKESHDAQRCCIDGCVNAVPANSRQQLCDDHGTNLLFAASLLGMLATEQT